MKTTTEIRKDVIRWYADSYEQALAVLRQVANTNSDLEYSLLADEYLKALRMDLRHYAHTLYDWFGFDPNPLYKAIRRLRQNF